MSTTLPLRAVLLDVGGTLIDSDPSPPEVYARVLSRWGPEVAASEVAPAFRATWAELGELHPPGLDRYHLLKGGERAWWGEFVRRVVDRLQHPAPWHEVLEELRRRGLQLAAVSNWDSRLPGVLNGLGLDRHFEVVLVSALEGVEKPSPVIFHRAVERLALTPAECLHVGDSPLDDYRGAESAGIGALLLDRHGLFSDGYRRIVDLRGIYGFVA